MTNQERDTLNHFLVEVFNEILKTEELSVSTENYSNLSLREIHILETVCKAIKNGADNSSTAIAAALRITPGTLTTAASLLERKGFLHRKKDENDKRIVRIYATEAGEKAQAKHVEFHKELVDNILSVLDDDEAHILVRGLKKIKTFFHDKYYDNTLVKDGGAI